ncbi:SUMF1/EgtB/PvdO family nonheme iron enzyme [Lewinella sp. W8]|uniref:SUMF1/EgtB/PvdO family nonheme iron enzyme n=1 Tax=Lewinella sp. W8 TaxID=2528208 RepID=UPI001068A3CF|nr:SUMF1/EgtB/PvdO family nonheme iron enzyme [Lewinella sp. W8]MTB52767.1 SUMF1/EgtB/PvdO family nonheme iron enzyme [Lewinella sp. W8]
MTLPRFFFFLALFLLVGVLPAKDYAIFFAVEDYQHMTKLTNPIDNATAIADELRDNYGFQIEVVPNPTFAEIAGKIQEYQQRFASGAFDQKGQLLIFFSGHGVQRGNNGYFIPKDGNPSKLYERVIEYDYWRNEIDQIACQHILVTVDACHSLTFDPNWRNKTDRNFGRRGDQAKDQVRLDYQSYRARLFFTSDGVNDQTPDRSTLARQFLLGLRTHRTANGYLSASELYAGYLKAAAPVPGGGDFGRDEPASRFLFFRKQAQGDISGVQSDLTDWRIAEAQDNCSGYRTYLQKHPRGDFASMARTKINSCEKEERMLAAWQNAKTRGDCGTYKKFNEDYPDSPYADLVREQLFMMNCKEETPPSVPQSPPTIEEVDPDEIEMEAPDNMVFIPGGTFQMGDQFGDGEDDEKPVHSVTVSDFYLSRTELTNREYAEFLSAVGNQRQGGAQWYDIESSYAGITGSGNSYVPKASMDDHPVVEVSWYGAVAYCNWLSERHGLTPVYRVSGTAVTPDWAANGYRLPTEAEWEYAARSGGKREKWAGTSSEQDLRQFANYDGDADGYARTAPVGMLRANNLGLADMSGNVWEWCWDWYASDYYGKSPGSNPKGPGSGTFRVIRGGSWNFYPQICRTARRSNYGPSDRNRYVGFRLARSSK